MPARRPITELQIPRLGEGLHRADTGLYLQVRGGSRSWLVRVMLDGKVSVPGLGAWPDVSLADAKKQAVDLRQKIKAGVDVPLERKVKRAEAKLEQSERQAAAVAALGMTFEQAMEGAIGVQRARWKPGNKSEGQWRQTLTTYGAKFMQQDVATITSAQLAEALKDDWHKKAETCDRTVDRFRKVFSYAAAMGKRTAPNPAAWEGALEPLLGNRQKVVESMPSLPYAAMPAFWKRLEAEGGIAACMMAFTILTGVRTTEARGMQWDEVDLKAKRWTVPAERMKMKRPHVVPLSDAAIALLKGLPGDQEGLVFVAPRGGMFSDMAMTAVLRRMDIPAGDASVHGFRASLRTFLGECTTETEMVRELCLAHDTRSKTQLAYDRSDYPERRAPLMQAWADHVTGKSAGKIVQLGTVRAA
ncbi:tyrosine-type recombinase/integrase [Cupriavidus pinatubonensis]|uniref:tyrosine-type recombinase/integrase n=1 Tax=Cupriavidus pinatubonensis TaxID=248026 RepID=UPI00112C53AF|nr:site-specific integrase [Cupriavidus pinatubonensis]TPQ35720.1 integrase [Cupriavidus pinatubonensis]